VTPGPDPQLQPKATFPPLTGSIPGRWNGESPIGLRTILFGAALAVSAAILLFPRVIFRGETFSLGDLELYYRPAKTLVTRLWRESGGIPLWNPYWGSGQPFAASPEHAIFHPLTAAFFLLPFETAFRLQVIVPPFLSIAAMAFFLRTMGRSRAASMFGGIAWGLGGSVLSTTCLLPILYTLMPLPAVLAFALRLHRCGRIRDGIALAATFGLECLGGEPSTLIVTAFATGALFLDHCRRRTEFAAAADATPPRPTIPIAAVHLVGALLLGAALGGAMLIPAAHYVRDSDRAVPGGLPASIADQWSFPPIRLVELLAPRATGHIDLDLEEPGWYWGSRLYADRHWPFLVSIYPGLAATLLAALAIRRKPRELWVWVALGLFGLLLAIGRHGPLWRLARHTVPLLAGIRYPEKFLVLFAFALVVCSAAGFDLLVSGPSDFLRSFRRAAAVIAVFAAAVGVFVLVISWTLGAQPWIDLGISPRLASRWGARVSLDFGCLALVAAAYHLAARLRPERAIAALLVITVIDLGVAGRSLVPTSPISNFAPPRFVTKLIDPPLPGPVYHASVGDPRRAFIKRRMEPPALSEWGVASTFDRDYDHTERTWSLRATELFSKAVSENPALAAPLLARRGVAAIMRIRPAFARQGSPIIPPEDAYEILKPRVRQPFVFFAKAVVEIASDSEWVAAVERLGSEASSAAVVQSREADGVPLDPSTGTANVLVRTPVRVLVDTEVSGPGDALLAVNQTWDEGWRARIDGRRKRVVRTDISLSAVVVPPGRHKVELAYRDVWIERGIVLSLSALLGAFFVLAADILRTRRAQRRGAAGGAHP